MPISFEYPRPAMVHKRDFFNMLFAYIMTPLNSNTLLYTPFIPSFVVTSLEHVRPFRMNEGTPEVHCRFGV